MISFLIVVAIVIGLLALVGFFVAVAVDMVDEGSDVSAAESAWMRGWGSLDWSSPGLESMSYGSAIGAEVSRPRLDRTWMSPTGPRARIILPLGVSGSHVDVAAVHRLEGLLPGTAPMLVVDRDRGSVTFGLTSRDPLAEIQRSSAHSSEWSESSPSSDPVADRVAYMEALAQLRREREGGAR
ncbi:hypothetical protein [Gordonia sputi]|uniref:hypothetical protein n=1 Tax=Gordonia sputi TaxID=36823 RepID=UPI002270B2BC|nr:hypothetical protein [Gordonia sputi]